MMTSKRLVNTMLFVRILFGNIKFVFCGAIFLAVGGIQTSEDYRDLETDSIAILGVYVLHGRVPVRILKNLQNNSNVFLVDVLSDKRLPGNGQAFGSEMIQ